MLQATRSGAGGRVFRLLIGALILVSAAVQFALVPVMPVYAHRFGLSGFEQGMVLGATGLATLVVSVPAGTLSDRFGPRRITLAAGLLMAAAAAAQALAGSFGVLLAARLAFGAGYGMIWTAGLCWLAGAAAGGPPALGGSVAAAGVGGVAGPAAAGTLAQHIGLAVPLLVTAAGFAVITAGLAAFVVPSGPATPRAGAMPGLRAVAVNRNLVGAAAAVVTAGLTTGVCSLLVPVLLQAAGASAGRIGLYFAAAGIMFAVGSAVTAAAGQRAVNLPVTCGGMLVLAAALTPAVVGATPLALLVMLCVATAARSVHRTDRAAVVTHSIATRSSGVEPTTARESAAATTSMPPQVTVRFTARRPRAAVSALPTANKIPAAAKARPICPDEAPAACRRAGTSRAQTPVLSPAVTTAAAAPIRSRFLAAGRSRRVLAR